MQTKISVGNIQRKLGASNLVQLSLTVCNIDVPENSELFARRLIQDFIPIDRTSVLDSHLILLLYSSA